HGLGPGNITVNGRKTTVRQEIKEAYGYLEEAKADISSLFAIQHMIDKGVLPKTLETTLYTTYLASTFRSIRFGIAEAHGRAVADRVLDPVCGMMVDPDRAAGHVEHGGNTYYFCSKSCVTKFTADPEKYLSGKRDSMHAPVLQIAGLKRTEPRPLEPLEPVEP